MDHSVKLRMGGQGISAAKVDQIAKFIEWMPGAENPNKQDQPSEAQVRGARVFQQAKCDTCHGGENFTLNSFANVGTLSTGPYPDDQAKLTKGGLNVPSLLNLARTAPYLHDGSAITLKERLTKDTSNQHGVTSTLTDGEKGDLVEFLKAL
jgi:cytochrome c peroxidase